MSEHDIVHAWKDPEDSARDLAPAHPSGTADLADLVGGLVRPELMGSEAVGTAGCCSSWADHSC